MKRPGASLREKKKLVWFAGGDYYIAKELLQRLDALCPEKCTLVEVFGGSGFISQNANREKFTNIIYNDADAKLTALYRAVKEKPELLRLALSLLPYSHEYKQIVKELLEEKELSQLVAGALLFYYVNATFFGKRRGGFAYVVDPSKNPARTYARRVSNIGDIASAWRDITIENLDFRECIKKYDSKLTVFYLDPPYPGRSSEFYGAEFTARDLEDLARMLSDVRGRFLLKLDADAYSMVAGVLSAGRFSVERLERVKMMDKKRQGARKSWTLVLVSNARPA